MPDLFSSKKIPAAKKRKEASTDAFITNTDTTEKQAIATPTENHFHALSSYCENPSQLIFHGKDITPTVRLLLRRHIVTNIPWILTTIILSFVPLLLQLLIVLSPNVFPPLPANFTLMFVLFYYSIVLMYAFISFLNWFYNIIIITDTEIIDIDYADVVYHDVAATNVNLIEDVQYVQSGFIRGFFNFGDVFVQTAGGKENIEAYAIPQPAKIARIILGFIGKGEND